MKSIDEFVDSIYMGIDRNSEEISGLKEEIKEHLIETVNELRGQGKTEEESLKIAYERFGDVKVINSEIFKLFHKQKKFIGFILILAVGLLLTGIVSYIFMSQRDLKFQTEQKILTRGILEIVGDDDNITEESKAKIEELVDKYDYVNYMALFKLEGNPKIEEEIQNNYRVSINGTYMYPFDIGMAKIIYPNNAEQLTTPAGYDRSTVVAANKSWVVQYEYKESIYRYVENYSNRIVYSEFDYSTTTFNYMSSICLIIIGATLFALWLAIKIYTKFNLAKLGY
ncbi:MAG: permease prefix domain 1-containing protein [Clostridium sp.]